MKLERDIYKYIWVTVKGKTTAALGQGLRSCGRGLKVYMVQFLKSGDTGELHSVEKLYPLLKYCVLKGKRFLLDSFRTGKTRA